MSSEIRPSFYELLCSYTGWTLWTVYRSERAGERASKKSDSIEACISCLCSCSILPAFGGIFPTHAWNGPREVSVSWRGISLLWSHENDSLLLSVCCFL